MKARAVIEAALVLSLTLGLAALVSLSTVGSLERQISNRPFIEHAMLILLPVLLLVVARRSPAS